MRSALDRPMVGWPRTKSRCFLANQEVSGLGIYKLYLYNIK
jgi:hypothetical protein